MSQPRQILTGSTYLITRRTLSRHKLLRPDEGMNQILVYVLAVAASLHGLQVHAFCAMSTHLHLVVTDVDCELPRFLQRFHRIVALCTKKHRNLQGPIWDKDPTSVVRLETPAAVVEKIAYVLANPVAAGLVRYAHEWPGAKVLVDEIGRAVLRATRPPVYFRRKSKKWTEEATLPITLPPGIAPEEADIFRRQVAAELERLEAQQEGRCFLGAEQAMQVSPEERATSAEPDVDRNPTFAVGSGPEQRGAFQRAVAAVQAFREAYRAAIEQWHKGIRDIVFPEGTWWMRVFHRTRVSGVVVAV